MLIMYFCAVFFILYRPLSGLEYNNVLIGIGIWYQMTPVPDLRDTQTRKWCQKMGLIYGTGFWISVLFFGLR